MKTTNSFFKAILSLLSLIYSLGSFSQAPQKMSYQAVIRNASNALVTNTTIGMRVSILQGSATGNAVYVETHNTTTNSNGLVNIQIGNGTPAAGSFTNINWGSGSYFIKTETDPVGGNNYTISGTSQLMSVPYALNSADNQWVDSFSDISNKNLGNVAIGKPSASAYGHGGSNKVLEIHNPIITEDAQSQLILSSASEQPLGSLGGINYVLPSISSPEKRMAYIGSEYNLNVGGNKGANLNFWTQNENGNLNKNMTISNAGVVSMPFSDRTTLDVGGFTKLGFGAPAIKIRKLTSTTSNTEGGFAIALHNLNFEKILSVSVLVNFDGTQYFPPNLTTGEVLYTYYIDANQVIILNSATNSGNILSKPVKIMITYEE